MCDRETHNVVAFREVVAAVTRSRTAYMRREMSAADATNVRSAGVSAMEATLQ
jgi:hypothetical protein